MGNTGGRETEVEVQCVCVWGGPGTPPEANSYSSLVCSEGGIPLPHLGLQVGTEGLMNLIPA